jgi:putative transposase
MASIFRSLLLVIAGSAQRELARQVRCLKVENEILRSKLPARITVTPKERQRLLKFGAKLGRAIRQLVTIVSPDTFLRWIREDKRAKKKGRKPAKRGRLKTAAQIRELILLMAKENNWGYARIVGELRKLGIHSVAKSTVRNILKEAGLDPCPKRAGSTWDEFVSQHAASLWQCDFFSQKVLTTKGIRDAFLLAFLHVETRRVVLSPATFHPDETWVAAQAETFVNQARGEGLRIRYVQHDRDGKFAPAFDTALKRRHVKIVRSPVCAPNCQAFVERFMGSIAGSAWITSSSLASSISIVSQKVIWSTTSERGRTKGWRMNCFLILKNGETKGRARTKVTAPSFRSAMFVASSGWVGC